MISAPLFLGVVLSAGSLDAVVDAGELHSLVILNAAKELPPLFGSSIPFARTLNDRNTASSIEDWERSTGYAPANVTPMALHKEELFFGSTDGRFRSKHVTEMEEAPVLLDTSGDKYIFLHRPVVTDETIFTTAGTLDLKGELSHRRDLGGILTSLFLPGIFGGGGHVNIKVKSHGSIYGLNRHNGSIKWELPTGFVGTPVLHENFVYYGGLGVRGRVTDQGAQDKASGGWQIAQNEGDKPDWNHIGYAGPRGVFGVVVPTQGKHLKVEEGGGLRLFGRDHARVESYDPASGKVLWHVEIGKVNDSHQPLNTSLVVDEEKSILYALAGHMIAAIDLKNAKPEKPLWRYDPAEELEKDKNKKAKEAAKLLSFTPGMEVHDGILYVGSSDRHLYAFNGVDNAPIWNYPARGTVGHPIYSDGKVIFGSSDGYVQSVNAQSGDLVWRVRTDSSILSQPLIHAGMVYVPTEDGVIYTLRVPLS